MKSMKKIVATYITVTFIIGNINPLYSEVKNNCASTSTLSPQLSVTTSKQNITAEALTQAMNSVLKCMEEIINIGQHNDYFSSEIILKKIYQPVNQGLPISPSQNLGIALEYLRNTINQCAGDIDAVFSPETVCIFYKKIYLVRDIFSKIDLWNTSLHREYEEGINYFNVQLIIIERLLRSRLVKTTEQYRNLAFDSQPKYAFTATQYFSQTTLEEIARLAPKVENENRLYILYKIAEALEKIKCASLKHAEIGLEDIVVGVDENSEYFIKITREVEQNTIQDTDMHNLKDFIDTWLIEMPEIKNTIKSLIDENNPNIKLSAKKVKETCAQYLVILIGKKIKTSADKPVELNSLVEKLYILTIGKNITNIPQDLRLWLLDYALSWTNISKKTKTAPPAYETIVQILVSQPNVQTSLLFHEFALLYWHRGKRKIAIEFIRNIDDIPLRRKCLAQICSRYPNYNIELIREYMAKNSDVAITDLLHISHISSSKERTGILNTLLEQITTKTQISHNTKKQLIITYGKKILKTRGILEPDASIGKKIVIIVKEYWVALKNIFNNIFISPFIQLRLKSDIELLKSLDGVVLQSTKIKLVNMGNKAIPSLMKVINKTTSVRKQVFDANEIAPQYNVNHIQNLLHTLALGQQGNIRPDVSMVTYTSEILVEIGLDAKNLSKIRKILSSKSVIVQGCSLWILGEVKDTNSASDIMGLLEGLSTEDIPSQYDWRICSLAIEALGKISDGRAIDTILKFNDYRDPVIISKINALSRFKEKKVKDFLIGVLNGNYSRYIREIASNALIEMDPDNATIWRYCLNLNQISIDQQKRLSYARYLCEPNLKTNLIIPMLLQILKEETNPEIQDVIARSLTDVFAKILLSRTNIEKRMECVTNLAQLGGQKAIAHLIRSLGTTDSMIHDEVVNKLESLINTDTVPTLVSLLEQENDINVIFFCIKKLGGLKDSRAIPILTKILASHDDITIRRISVEALGQIAKTEQTPALIGALINEKNSSLRTIIFNQLASLDKDNLEIYELANQLNDNAVLDTSRTIQLLRKHEKSTNLLTPILLKILQGDTIDNELKLVVLEMLANTKEKLAVPIIINSQNSLLIGTTDKPVPENLCLKTIQTLVRIDDPRVIPMLFRILPQVKNPQIMLEIIKSLVHLRGNTVIQTVSKILEDGRIKINTEIAEYIASIKNLAITPSLLEVQLQSSNNQRHAI